VHGGIVAGSTIACKWNYAHAAPGATSAPVMQKLLKRTIFAPDAVIIRAGCRRAAVFVIATE